MKIKHILESSDSCPVCGQTPCNCTHIAEGLRDPKDNPCWKGYHPVGTKKKNGKTVPNCVPKEDVEEAYPGHIQKGRELDAATRKIQANLDRRIKKAESPASEIERLKLRQNAEHGSASLKRQAATQARIRELEKQIKDKKGVAEGSEIEVPTQDGIGWQDIRLLAGEGKLTQKTIKQAIDIIRRQRKEQGVAEGSGQEPGDFEIYDLRTMQRVYHPFEADNIMDAFVKADDWLEAIGKSGRGLSVRPVREQGVAEGSKKQVKPKYEVRVTPTTGMFHIHDIETGKRVAKDVAYTRMKAYEKLEQWNKKQGVAEGMAGIDDAEPYTIGGAVDKQYVYTVMRDGKSMGIYHSLDDAKLIVANNKRINKYSKFKIQRKPRSKMAGPVGQLPEQGVAEGSDAEAYKQKLLSSLPQMMRFYEKNVKGWKPSEEQMLAAVETGYTVMKHTGDVKQAGKAVMDELNTLHRMSQGQQGVAEGSLNEGQYEMMMRNGQVKKFIAKDDADAKRIAAGYGAKSVIRLKGGVPAGKVSEQGIAESQPEKIGGRHDPDEFDAMVNRLKKLAGSGPMKTVYDPKTRRYKNIPTAVQPGDKK